MVYPFDIHFSGLKPLLRYHSQTLSPVIILSFLNMHFALFGVALSLIASAAASSLPHSHSNRGRAVNGHASSQETIPGYFDGSCTKEKMTIRKEWRHLSRVQQTDFLDAVQCLMDQPAKSGLTATTSRFSDLQALHRGMTNTAYADIIHHVVGRDHSCFVIKTKPKQIGPIPSLAPLLHAHL